MMSWVCGGDGGADAGLEWTGDVAGGWWKEMKLTEIRHNCLYSSSFFCILNGNILHRFPHSCLMNDGNLSVCVMLYLLNGVLGKSPTLYPSYARQLAWMNCIFVFLQIDGHLLSGSEGMCSHRAQDTRNTCRRRFLVIRIYPSVT